MEAVATFLSIPKSPNPHTTFTTKLGDKEIYINLPKTASGNKSPTTIEPAWYEKQQKKTECLTHLRTETPTTAITGFLHFPEV